MVAAAVPAWMHSGWWAAHRTPALSAVRLLLVLLVTAQVALLPPPLVSDGGAVGALLALLGDSGAAALFWLPFRCVHDAWLGLLAVLLAVPVLDATHMQHAGRELGGCPSPSTPFVSHAHHPTHPCRFSLPFSIHLPIHLLCLWCLTVGATLAHVRGGGGGGACPANPSITAVILSQLVFGFLLASVLAYLREAGRRRRFLLTSHRAAACLRRQALPPTSPPALAPPPVPKSAPA